MENKNTLQYYNENAKDFVAGTMNADMSDVRNRFLSYMPDGGLLLDWGCGSGRDSLAFQKAGYVVEASDAAEELCRLASEKLGQEVRNESFADLDEEDKYDGIWACASLLHLVRDDLPGIFDRAGKALKPGGIMYVSFKYGDFQGERKGRYFTDMTEESFAKVIEGRKQLQVIEQWITEDVRADRSEKWLNVILEKM